MKTIREEWKWFPESKYGLFIHWGPYAQLGRGEQVLFREHMDQRAYAREACQWNPSNFNPAEWARTAKKAGMKYACLTTRHHDGYCLWDSRLTDYTSAKQAPKRDFVREFAEAFRAEGLRVGFYYSWLDWRIPAYFEGPGVNPAGWAKMKKYMHGQVEELLSNYGKIDYFFFDGVWPRNAEELGSAQLVKRMRELQPGILINNRLGASLPGKTDADGGGGAGGCENMGDFGTPERVITPESGRLWESCQVSTWRLWGYTQGEHWLSAETLLDMLCDCVEQGGNMILNVGPRPDGSFPPEFEQRALAVGKWLEQNGEVIYGADGGNLTEAVTYGRQILKGNLLYLIIRFWDGRGRMRIADLMTPVKKVTLLATGQELAFSQNGNELLLDGLPEQCPGMLPVIRVECDGRPQTNQWGRERLWGGDPLRVAAWAAERGFGVNADGSDMPDNIK